MHRTQLLTKWGKSEYFEVGVHAKAEFRTESKATDISLGWKSSIDELESFQLSAKTELQPEILENSLKILVFSHFVVLKPYFCTYFCLNFLVREKSRNCSGFYNGMEF